MSKTIKQMIEVMTAYEEGKKIEIKQKDEDMWELTHILRKERDKAQELYNKVQTKDFTESNCKYFNGFEEYEEEKYEEDNE